MNAKVLNYRCSITNGYYHIRAFAALLKGHNLKLRYQGNKTGVRTWSIWRGDDFIGLAW